MIDDSALDSATPLQLRALLKRVRDKLRRMDLYCVYEHWRPDTNVCFYVGLSGDNGRRRPYNRADRSLGHSAVQFELEERGLNFFVVIRQSNLSLTEAKKLETELIKSYGRIDLGSGTLVNVSEGGGAPAITETAFKRLSPKRAAHMRRLQKIITADPEIRKRQAASLRLTLTDPVRRAKQAEFLRSPEVKARVNEARYRPDVIARRSAAIKKAANTPEARAAISSRSTAYWSSPENRAAQSARLKGVPKRRKNKPPLA
jgi:hypothetical protein